MEYYKPKDKREYQRPSLHDPFTTPKIIIIRQKCIFYILKLNSLLRHLDHDKAEHFEELGN